jgi:hypothetical protein
MKTRITLAMACFIVFVLSSAAVAYHPLWIVRECPHCKTHVVEQGAISAMITNAKYWTDGYVYATGLPSNRWLVKCPVCAGLFFIDEALEVGQGFAATKDKEPVLAPSEREILGFLAENVLPKDKEVFLRIRVWWSANHTWRWEAKADSAFSEVQAQNLNALSKLLDESEPGQRILKTEIARELGDFEQCLLLLSYQFEAGYDRATGFIKKLAEEKVRAVKPFVPGK